LITSDVQDLLVMFRQVTPPKEHQPGRVAIDLATTGRTVTLMERVRQRLRNRLPPPVAIDKATSGTEGRFGILLVLKVRIHALFPDCAAFLTLSHTDHLFQ
jgi:hypothetical protein